MIWEILWGFEPALITGFVIAGLILNITPGADFLYIMSSGLSGGSRIGVAAALGVNLGVVVHILAAAAGLSALLFAHPAAYDLIRICGAAYLAWMAVQVWRRSSTVARARSFPDVRQAARRGFFINVSNPKTALFIFAFIPQFTDPTIGPIWVQILILGAIFLLNGAVFTLCLGVGSGYFAAALGRRVGVLNKISAILLGGLAARLIID
ncbi:MAG: LysE family translocator [Rhodobacteraceae bacterium]|jgi:threonine/homoserine/homoserine lactone efflux protein|nr:LysE family translocator [Paracoccaceae bacterium]MBT6522027.1 LysE family translocator [Paracoccaceae bacterium]MBT7342018.1 LysE family translocator [Paracoccaceae bacterium]